MNEAYERIITKLGELRRDITDALNKDDYKAIWFCSTELYDIVGELRDISVDLYMPKLEGKDDDKS